MRLLKLAVATVGAAIAGFVCAFSLPLGGKLQRSTTTYVPFTARMVEEEFPSASAVQPGLVQNITFARRSNGSEVKSITEPSPDNLQVGQLVSILDVSASTQITLEPFTKSIMTFFLSQKALDRAIDSNKCPTDLNDLNEHSKILGYDVVRHREKWDVLATDDEWIAPDLACFSLKKIFAASWGAWNRTTVVSLTEGEPPTSMFDIPAGYVERSPSGLETAWSGIFRGSQFLPDSSIRNMDQTYYRGRNGR
jgi:hypothetical protein